MALSLQEEFAQQAEPQPPEVDSQQSRREAPLPPDIQKMVDEGKEFQTNVDAYRTLLDDKDASPVAIASAWNNVVGGLSKQTNGFTETPGALANFIEESQVVGSPLPDAHRDFAFSRLFDITSQERSTNGAESARETAYIAGSFFPPKDNDKWGPLIGQTLFDNLHDLQHADLQAAAETSSRIYNFGRNSGTDAENNAWSSQQKAWHNSLGGVVEDDLFKLTKTGEKADRQKADEIAADLLGKLKPEDPIYNSVLDVAQNNRAAMKLPPIDVQALHEEQAKQDAAFAATLKSLKDSPAIAPQSAAPQPAPGGPQ